MRNFFNPIAKLFISNPQQDMSLVDFKIITESISDSIVVVDLCGKILFHNKQFLTLMSGGLIDDFTGINFTEYVSSPHDAKQIISSLLNAQHIVGAIDVPLRSLDHSLALTRITVHSLSQGKSCLIIRDSSLERDREVMLIKEAKTDRLTGLLNRKGFDERLEATLDEVDSDSQYKVGVLFIDLDEFKPVNDTYGHDAGDHMLITVAERLSSVLSDHETSARIGGDEFVCIIPVCNSSLELEERGLEVLQAVAAPVEFQGHTLVVKCSIGGAFHSAQASTSSELLKNADRAMYEAKGAGKNQVRVL